MAGIKKRKQVNRLHNAKWKVYVELFLLPDNSFVGEYEGREIGRGDSAREVEQQAWAYLEELLSLEWQEAIFIDYPEGSHIPTDASGFFFIFEKRSVAYDPRKLKWVYKHFHNGQWTPYEISIEPRRPVYTGSSTMMDQPKSPLTLPVQTYTHAKGHGGGLRAGAVYIAYTDEAWGVLESVASRLRDLEAMLKILTAEPGLNTLISHLMPQAIAPKNPRTLLLLPAETNQGAE